MNDPRSRTIMIKRRRSDHVRGKTWISVSEKIMNNVMNRFDDFVCQIQAEEFYENDPVFIAEYHDFLLNLPVTYDSDDNTAVPSEILSKIA